MHISNQSLGIQISHDADMISYNTKTFGPSGPRGVVELIECVSLAVDVFHKNVD